MSSDNARYSRLAPFSLQQRFDLTLAALQFFHPLRYRDNCEILGKTVENGKIQAFTGFEFLTYLKRKAALAEPDRYLHRIGEFLVHLARSNVLTQVGGQGTGVECRYWFMKELSQREQEGVLWLAQSLGPEFLYHAYSQAIVQVTGVTKNGDLHAGTGLIVAANWLLTCAHVLQNMRLDDEQLLSGAACKVVRHICHPRVDVGLIEFAPPVETLRGLAFRSPILAEPIYAIGYPRIPLSRTPGLVMQRGEVTNPGVTLFDGRTVFLYSAIARPGNSGGPLISETGCVVGIVTEELLEDGKAFRMPFHAGIETMDVLKALEDLGAPVGLPLESYE